MLIVLSVCILLAKFMVLIVLFDTIMDSDFVYFKSLPRVTSNSGSATELMCVQKLWDNVSMDTVTDIQACADMYNCLELKDKCADFIAKEKKTEKPLISKTI